MTVADQVKHIIGQHLGMDDDDVVPEALFRDDLGSDSLDAFELLLAFEDAFGIEIPDTDAGRMRCVHDAVAYIEAHVAAGGAHVSLDAPSKDGWPGTGSVHH